MELIAENDVLVADLRRLEAAGHKLEILRDGAQVGVVFCRFPLQHGIFNCEETNLLLETTIHYPLSAMDMFWVDPDLLLADGRVPGGGESLEVHFGRTWRRFSWHRNCGWVPGRDDIAGHLEFARARLERNE